MDFNTIMQIVTILVTLVLGLISKKSTLINNKLIPIQNLAIGLIMAIIGWFITKDFSSSIALSGITSGGAYDIINNLNKLLKEEGK